MSAEGGRGRGEGGDAEWREPGEPKVDVEISVQVE